MSYQSLDPDATHINMPSDESNPALEDDDPDTTAKYPFGTPVYLTRPEAQQALLLYREEWRHMVSSHLWTWLVALAIAIVMLIALTFKHNDEFQPPIPLVIFYTLLDAFVIGGFVGLLYLTCVMDMLIILTGTGLVLFLYTFQTSWKFYNWQTSLVASVSVVIFLAGLHPWVFSITDGIIAGIFAFLLVNFFVVDTWYMMKTMFKNEYWAASMHLHLDLLVPIKCIHHVCEVAASDGDSEEEYDPISVMGSSDARRTVV